MPIVKAWVATQSGLPSFHLTGPGTLSQGDRKIASLVSGQTLLLSDAFASADTPLVYKYGSASRTLKRVPPKVVYDDGMGFVTDLQGRSVADIYMIDNGLPVKWSSGASIFASGAVRFPLLEPQETGTSEFLVEPESVEAFWLKVKKKEPVIIGSYVGLPNVPVRVVVLGSVSRERIGSDGSHIFKLSWVDASRRLSAKPAGVVTWEEWQLWGETNSPSGWQNWSEIEVAQRVAGMPV